MATLQEIENLLNIEIGERQLRQGRKYPDKNKYYRYDDYYIVKLTQDKWMIVSNTVEVRRLLRLYIWYHTKDYARTSVDGTKKYFHQLYLNYEDGLVCDHINRKKYDNRFENLRIVTHIQNSRNKSIAINNTTGYTGIDEYTQEGYIYYRVSITDNNNKRIKKKFNIAKWGRDEALRKAIEQRRLWEAEYGYNEQ
mgnify:CR=1 FL=1